MIQKSVEVYLLFIKKKLHADFEICYGGHDFEQLFPEIYNRCLFEKNDYYIEFHLYVYVYVCNYHCAYMRQYMTAISISILETEKCITNEYKITIYLKLYLFITSLDIF